jgi:hypothetical protein
MKRGASAALLLVFSLCTAVARDIPLAEVLAKPRDFDGKRVAVTGYYVAATETSCLFTTRDAAKRFDIARSVWVEFRTPPVLDSIAGHQARLVGTFHLQPAREGWRPPRIWPQQWLGGCPTRCHRLLPIKMIFTSCT